MKNKSKCCPLCEKGITNKFLLRLYLFIAMRRKQKIWEKQIKEESEYKYKVGYRDALRDVKDKISSL